MAEDTFYKRPGTTDKGREYEDLMVANLILKLINDDKRDFQISSNDNSFGALDDIILETKTTKGKEEKYAIQLKHVSNPKTLPKGQFTQASGNYGIQKYFQSFKTFNLSFHKLVVFTTLRFDLTSANSIIELPDEGLSIRILKSTLDPLLNTSQQGNCYQFQVDNDKVSFCKQLKEYKAFFKNFYLYTDQAVVAKVKEDTWKKFQEIFSCEENDFDMYVKLVVDWSKCEGKKQKLTKNLLKRAIAIRLLSPFVQSISSTSVNTKARLLREAISKFNVTLCEKCSGDQIAKIWGDVSFESDDIKEIVNIRQKYQLASRPIEDLNNKERAKIFWLMNKCPLIVSSSPKTYKVVQLCQNDTFVIVGSNTSGQLHNLSVFQNLSNLDLIDSKIYQKILKEFKLSLQGKAMMSLQFLMEHYDIQNIITTDLLVQMLDDTFVIGEEKEMLPIPHMDRLISTAIINYKLLSKPNKKTVILISSMDKLSLLADYLHNVNLIKTEEYFKNSEIWDSSSENTIFISEACFQKEFELLCKRTKSTKCHHFRVTNDGRLEWIASKGSIKILEKFRSNIFIEESQLYAETSSSINLICADPGMGKSTFIKNLKNNQPSTVWTIIIQPNDVSSYFRENSKIDGFVEYVEEKKYQHCRKFDRDLLSTLKKNGQIVYIWDGLDEISDHNLEFVLQIIKKLSKRVLIQWITSRCHLKNFLEKEFNVFSRTISQFDDKQQNIYIEQRLRECCSKNNIKDIVKKIKENVEIVRHNDVLEIPLQIFMLTELFRQNPKKYLNLLNNIFSITDLYYHFINERFDLYYLEKAQLNSLNNSLLRIIEDQKKSFTKMYQEAALKSIFEKNIFESLNIDCDHFMKKTKEEGDCFGFVTEVSKDMIPTFQHNTFGEYFVALYLTKNTSIMSNLKAIIFQERYNNVRFFFDLLMAENCPAHMAVLYKNPKLLKKFQNGLKNKDQCGRNALHLACSWGQRYPLLNSKREGQVYIVDDEEKENCVKEEDPAYHGIVEFLTKECNSTENDELFKMNSLSYADSCLCLLPFALAHQQNINFSNFVNFKDIISVLYYSVKCGFAKILDLIKDIPVILTQDQRTLLHLSVEHDHEDCLKKLLSIEDYKKRINDGDKNGATPLTIACKNTNNTILQLLIASGADINKPQSNGATPLYIACENGNLSTVQTLKNLGANIHISKKTGLRPIEVACQQGHCQVVEFLYDAKIEQNLDKTIRGRATLLYLASENGHHNIVKFLIKSKVKIDIARRNGCTPIHIASENGFDGIVQTLISRHVDVDCTTKNNVTPLFLACESGHFKVAQILIKAGAEVNKTTKSGITPIETAVRNGHTEIVRLLLDTDRDVIRDEGTTLMDQACLKGYLQIAQILINHGVKVKSNLIHVAINEQRFQIVRLLIDHGINLDNFDDNGFAPIHTASRKDDCRIVQLLINSGCDINKTMADGRTALHIACEEGNLKTVEVLVAGGANINCITKSGLTPIQMARKQSKIVRLLLASAGNDGAKSRKNKQ